MALKDIVRKTETIQVGETSVTVHGLSMEDIAGLLDDHRTALQSFFEADGVSVDLIQEASASVAAIIARAADEPDAEEQVSLIAIGDQIKLIQAIWRLTNITAEDLGNMMSGVLDGLRSFNQVKDHIHSTSGSKT